MNLLAEIYSGGNKLKRLLGDFVADPIGNIQQGIGYANDRAGSLNRLTALAAQEHVNSITNGGGMGANQNKLAMMMADAYNPVGMVVWHGSPHKFTKFDSSKIGTGEGAQAYGHGLYLAESPEVAKAYAQAGDAAAPVVKNWLAEADDAGIPASQSYQWARNEIANRLRTAKSPGVRATLSDALARFDELVGGGNTYKVDLPDDAIAKMLDWDKPLSQQAPEVQALIKKTKAMLPPNAMDDLGGDLSLLYGGQNTGADFLGTMNSLQPNFGETALQRVGVPGVRYLDGGSRGAGSGTSNFVVFPGNEGLLKILERNGKPLE